MDILQTIVKFGIYTIMAVSVLAAFGAVMLRNIFHASLALIVALIGTAGIFIALHAEFLAVVQILLYVGAVMTLVIFSIMMTEGLSDKSVPQRNNLALPALIAVLIFWAVLAGLIIQTPWVYRLASPLTVTMLDLGKSLLNQYVFPFEVISVFLVAALIGAIVIAKKEKP